MTLAALVLLLPLPAAADPPPRVRVEVSPKDGAWVGQRVTLAVTLSTPDLFAGAPAFDLPPVPGVVVLPPAGSPTIGSETIGDTTFTTQRHEFAVYAQRAGVVRIPAFAVRFETNSGFGTPSVERRVSDAFTRTLTVTATDVPGMVFPPLHPDAVAGLAAYPKPPAVTDTTDRGALTGRRAEAVTYVCERPGEVAVPDRTLTWWDLDANELKTVALPGRTFEVRPIPQGVIDHMPTPEPRPRTGEYWWWLVPAAGVVLFPGTKAFNAGDAKAAAASTPTRTATCTAAGLPSRPSWPRSSPPTRRRPSNSPSARCGRSANTPPSPRGRPPSASPPNPIRSRPGSAACLSARTTAGRRRRCGTGRPARRPTRP